jgi:hypothetical protein
MRRHVAAAALAATIAALGASAPAGASLWQPHGLTAPPIGGSFPCLNRLSCSFGGYSSLFFNHALPSDISTQIGVPAVTVADAPSKGYVAGILSISFTKKLSLTAGWIYDAKSGNGLAHTFWRQRSATVKGKLHYATAVAPGGTLPVDLRWSGSHWVVTLGSTSFDVDPSVPGPSPSNIAQVFRGAEETSSASTLGRVAITGLPADVNGTEVPGICAQWPVTGTGAVWSPPPTCPS